MVRYVPRIRRARALWDDTDNEHDGYSHPSLSISVHEPRDDEPAETGLYDHHGNPLMRLPEERRPIGFLADIDR